jgi:serine/threonine protein kinase
MGAVYRAEQRHPVRRVVALKLIRQGMATREVIARFDSERQALAMMNHPNVARVLDAGTSDDGRQYFVMEYVAGEPITAFCDRHQYTTSQRLELFTQACEAIQHAHQKAIIHRDLKPTNILVSLQNGKPVVKVIDFGVAKATSHKLTERTLFTETGRLVGTPEYMSPEQAEMSALDVDTRTDIYSLGVVLYELLAGALPFDSKELRGAGFSEIQRIIREVDPPRPSTRLSNLGAGADEVAGRRRMRAEDLRKQLRGELEWIPLKAMRKDRTQRYKTADQLAEDVGNYLANRPLIAGPESAAYLVKKFLRRNKAPVIATAAVVLALLLGFAATTIALIGQARARAEAEKQRAQTESANENLRAVVNFFTNGVIGAANPAVTQGKELSVREALDSAAGSIQSSFGDRPIVDAAVRHALAETYLALGRYDIALPHARAALQKRRAALGENHPDTLTALSATGRILQAKGDSQAAEPLFRQAVQARRAISARFSAFPSGRRKPSRSCARHWRESAESRATIILIRLLRSTISPVFSNRKARAPTPRRSLVRRSKDFAACSAKITSTPLCVN